MQFPNPTVEQVLARTTKRWSLDQPLPLPKGDWLACPICGCEEVRPRYWKFHQRPKPATLPWRCDVSFKCFDCAAVWVHGVAISEHYYRRNSHKRARRLIWWHEGKPILDAHQS